MIDRKMWNRWLEKLKGAVKQYKYPIVILLLGVGLMLLPAKEETPEPAKTEDTVEQQHTLQEELETVLSQVEGAGDVRVLLSWDTGVAYEYQTDVEQRNEESGTEEKRTTVLVSSGDTETPVVVRTIYPICKGAVVVCQGADSAAVKLALVRAVSSITGLGSDRITVIKMKSGK